MTPRLDSMQYQHVTDIDRLDGNGDQESAGSLVT